MAASTFNVTSLRKHFPALDQKQIYFDNAGGSQALQEVVDSVSSYLSGTNVQLGASYPIAQQATKSYTEGKAAAAKYINSSPDEVVLGPSTTQLFRNLSLALYNHLTPGSEIILSKLDHEANIASWLALASWRSCTIKWWTPSSTTNPHLEPSVLATLLSPKTKLVACTHTSNILGSISDIRAIAQTVHTIPGALLVVDAVAYAPHAHVDVANLEVDFYAFSWYKVYGPHIAMLYAAKSTHGKLATLGHYFKRKDTLEDLLGLSNASYELVAAVPAVCGYLADVPWEEIARHEEVLQGVLLGYLGKRKDVRVWGERSSSREKRVPVISFTVEGWKSRDVVERVEGRSSFGCRWGSFYSNRLVEEVLGLDAGDGVVRVSLVHYNTEEEVREFVKVLDEVLEG